MTLEEGGRRRVATLSLKLGLLLGLLLLPPLAGDASLAATRSRAGGTRGQIVFLSDRTPGLGSFGVAVMNGDGSVQHLLTRPEPRATDPVWLPGGRQIAFESVASPGDWEVYGGVWLMRADGARLRWAVHGFSRWSIDPTWSPDGRRMAFVRNNSLYVARPDGRGQHRVFRNYHLLGRPTWAPNGRRLAVMSGSFGLGISRMLVLAVGSGRAKLVFRTRQTAWAPSWSPDGRKIAFIGETRGHFNLFVMNADGTHSRRLTAGVELANWITPPSWSPDSTRIVIGRVKRPAPNPMSRSSMSGPPVPARSIEAGPRLSGRRPAAASPSPPSGLRPPAGSTSYDRTARTCACSFRSSDTPLLARRHEGRDRRGRL